MPPPTGVVSGPLIPTREFLERVDRVVGQPVVELGLRCLAREDLEPRDLFLAAVGHFFTAASKTAFAGCPDVAARTVAADKRDDRIIRDGENTVCY